MLEKNTKIFVREFADSKITNNGYYGTIVGIVTIANPMSNGLGSFSHNQYIVEITDRNNSDLLENYNFDYIAVFENFITIIPEKQNTNPYGTILGIQKNEQIVQSLQQSDWERFTNSKTFYILTIIISIIISIMIFCMILYLYIVIQ